MNNNNYYQPPIFQNPNNNSSSSPPPAYPLNYELLDEQSYIENILRLNRGKMATFYVTIPGSNEWRDKTFTGIIEQSGRDHIIVSDPTNGKWYLILMIYLDYVTFDEQINYSKEFTPHQN